MFLAISTVNCRNSSSQFKQPFWLLGWLLRWNDKLKEQKLKGHVFNFASSFASPVRDALMFALFQKKILTKKINVGDLLCSSGSPYLLTNYS